MKGMRRVIVTLMVAGMVGAPGQAAGQAATERRLRALEESLREAQQEIERLRGEMRQQKAISQGTQTQIEESRKATEEQVKKGLTVPDWLKTTSLFGDVRVRHEGFYHQPSKKGTSVTARNRERVRARIGARAKFSDELSATIRIASGNPDDPISTNETLTNTFTRKNIALDWTFLTFTPGKTFNMRPGVVAITAGKFPNPIFRPGELVFDDDLSPEGASETFQLLGKPMGPLEQFKVHALQWTFNEVRNAEDGWMFGGQLNPSFTVGGAQIEAGVGQFWYLNDDAIAQAKNDNDALAITNDVVEVDDEIVAFVPAFNLTNAGFAVTVPNVIGTMPVRVFGDYVHNFGAIDNRDDEGAMGGVKLGQTKARGDWAFLAAYEYLETNAVMSAFSGSDFGLGGTNQQGPVAGIEYQLLDPLTLSAKNYFTNFINRPADTRNPTLFRLQLDALVKF